MKSVDELIENGYVKVGSKSYCEYWKKGDDYYSKEIIALLCDKGLLPNVILD